jgi:hypothetical protein
MLGALGKNPAVGIAAGVLIVLAGSCALCRPSRRPQVGSGAGQVVVVCLKEGTRFLAPAPGPREAAPKCPTCGGESAVGRVFECPRGHLFVGFLEKPPATDAPKGGDDYAAHLPLLRRPGLDADWTPGGAGRSPACPVCQLGIQRALADLTGLKLEDIQMGALTAPGGGK